MFPRHAYLALITRLHAEAKQAGDHITADALHHCLHDATHGVPTCPLSAFTSPSHPESLPDPLPNHPLPLHPPCPPIVPERVTVFTKVMTLLIAEAERTQDIAFAHALRACGQARLAGPSCPMQPLILITPPTHR